MSLFTTTLALTLFLLMGVLAQAQILTEKKVIELHRAQRALEVGDSFHVVKKINDVMDICRRELVESPETRKSEKKA